MSLNRETGRSLQRGRFVPYLAGVCGGLLMWIWGGNRVEAASVEPDFSFSSDSNTVVFAFREEIGHLQAVDSAFTVQVYGDGRLSVYYPPAMRKAGTYTAQLSRGETRSLLAGLIQTGLAGFDAPAVSRAKAASLARRGPAAAIRNRFPARSDAEIVTLTLRLETCRNAAGEEEKPFEKTVSWQGLKADVRMFPDLPSLQGLQKAVAFAEKLARRKDLVPVSEEDPSP